MAISMSGATIDSSEREALNSSQVDSSITGGGVSANKSGGFFGLGAEVSGAALAGVTASFASNVSKEIDNYKTEVKSYLDQLQDANSEVAFKGDAVKAALTSFIDSVRAVAQSYLDKLEAAEKQIVESVASAYSTQDTDLSGDMKTDSSSLESTSI